MNIHEYQAKELLAKYGVPVPAGFPALSVDEAVNAARMLGRFARSPVVAIAGDPDQYAAGGGLAYSF